MTTAERLSGVPNGYMRNAAGHLVPEANVREQDKLRDQLVKDLAQQAIEINEKLAQFKAKALADIADLIEISNERYGVSLGGSKGNVQLISYDGDLKITRSIAERITFTEELFAAKKLITNCIDRWTQGSDANIRALVDRAFKENGKGQIKTSAILDLLRLEFQDEEWLRAMDALKDSIQTTGTAVYVRVYKRVADSDEYLPVPLDLAAVSVGTIA